MKYAIIKLSKKKMLLRKFHTTNFRLNYVSRAINTKICPRVTYNEISVIIGNDVITESLHQQVLSDLRPHHRNSFTDQMDKQNNHFHASFF